MIKEIEIQKVYTKEEIIKAIQDVFSSSAEFYETLPAHFFSTSPKSGWSPEKNLRHLSKSVIGTLLGFNTPKIMTKILFGNKKSKSRTYTEIKESYLKKLDTGRGAGVFKPVGGNEIPNTENQKKLCRKWLQLGDKLKIALSKLSEEELDSLYMPHPILGKLSLREMSFFSIYHVLHHTQKVIDRMH